MEPYWNPELETKPWPEVVAWQCQRVAQTIADLRARSAFYRRKLEGVGGAPSGPEVPRWLGQLPLTSKDELRRAQDVAPPGQPLGAQQAVDLRRVVRFVSSSGTTGRPVYYGLTRADVEAWADGVANAFFTAGIRPDDVVAHLVSLPMVAGGTAYALGFERIGAAVAWLGGLPPERMLESMASLQASAVLATTSFVSYLSEHGERLSGRPARQLGVRKVLGGGEPGLGEEEIRSRVAAGWGTDHVRDTMGLGDVLASMWAECDDASGMHFNGQAHVLVELIDPLDQEPLPWREGVSGEAVYTTLDREATPVLRFRSGDHLVVTGTSCRCGRTSPKVRCLGRTDDMLIYKGMNVFPTAIRNVALDAAGEGLEPQLRIWKEHPTQVRFDDPIPVEVEARPDVAAERYSLLARRVEEAVRSRLQVRVAVTVTPPGSIPRSAYKAALVQVRSPDLAGRD
jgi:phenylacetate-coenzyme A ligase PaaK-like adenylate-forming protein